LPTAERRGGRLGGLAEVSRQHGRRRGGDSASPRVGWATRARTPTSAASAPVRSRPHGRSGPSSRLAVPSRARACVSAPETGRAAGRRQPPVPQKWRREQGMQRRQARDEARSACTCPLVRPLRLPARSTTMLPHLRACVNAPTHSEPQRPTQPCCGGPLRRAGMRQQRALILDTRVNLKHDPKPRSDAPETQVSLRTVPVSRC
jgi:hypothetical protein